MKFLIDNSFLAKVVNLAFLSISIFALSQNGTYELKNKNGSYCYISFQKNGHKVTAEIFAWWNIKSGQTGSYFGRSQSTSNKYILKSDENDPDCKVTLQLDKDKILANFNQCTIDHLPHNQVALGSSPGGTTLWRSSTYSNVGAFLFWFKYNISITVLLIQR